jgi:pyruvate/2-oxoglutarate/acetoin dehydrogenase E1 component
MEGERIKPVFSDNSPMVNGREILRDNWDKISRKTRCCCFGEDVGGIGGVNQSYEGIQTKYGKNRITDTEFVRPQYLVRISFSVKRLRPITKSSTRLFTLCSTNNER